MDNNSQKLGGSMKMMGAEEFVKWKIDNHLLEIPHQGVNFTWTNNRQGQDLILERLDRGF